ncbi:hypothetical protein BpHYR1_016781 [Brachionus plicatilis]|uniref:Uncharacterized protein n=1 Tax=Brachionus plicatilis TaxID=10195 RepID=A0A3M7PNU7_BRAPC|nr:hypothetical protein BpHYR1_016781 [Brachionus plicatilis]
MQFSQNKNFHDYLLKFDDDTGERIVELENKLMKLEGRFITPKNDLSVGNKTWNNQRYAV